MYAADLIRATASLMVAIFHLGGKALPVLNYGWLGVELFFVLSGFIICWALPPDYAIKNAGAFIWRRIVRIEPPYIISILLVVVLNLITLVHFKIDWFNLFMHMGYLNNYFNRPYLNPVYWTLGIEFQYYLFIAVAFPFLIKNYGHWLLLVLTGITTLIHPQGLFLSNVFPLFALGILCFQFKRKYISLPVFLMAAVVIAAICFLTMGFPQSIAGVLAFLILLVPVQKNRFISFFAKISFSLYLTHDVVGSRIVVYLGTMLPKTLLFKGGIFGLGLIISIGFAYLFYLAVEKPFLKISKSISNH